METRMGGAARRSGRAKRVLRVVSLASIISGLSVGCGEEHERSCTAIGCLNTITLSGHVPSSVLELDVRVCEDDECLEVALDLPEPEATSDPGSCVTLGVGSTGSVCARSATGASRHIRAEVDVPQDAATTYRMSVRDRASGEVLLDGSGVPTFTEYYPNGKECDRVPCLSGTLNVGE